MSTTSATSAPPLSPFASSWQARQQPGRPPILPRCAGCGAWIWPVQPFCPHCLAEALAWCETTGRGRLLVAVAFHRGMAPDGHWPAGWRVGLVRLEEGVPVWAHLGRKSPPGEEEPVRLAVARDRRGRFVLVAAEDQAGLEEIAASLSS